MFIAKELPELVELDLNPVIVTADGATIVDCRPVSLRATVARTVISSTSSARLSVLRAKKSHDHRVRRVTLASSPVRANWGCPRVRRPRRAHGEPALAHRTLKVGSVVALNVDDLATLIARLSEMGYEVKGPVVRSGAIVPGPLSSVEDLPKGSTTSRPPERTDWCTATTIASSIGPSDRGAGSLSSFPHEEVWRARIENGHAEMVEIRGTQRPLAVFGARPCEVAALEVLDRVFVGGAHQDARYAQRRADAFVAVVECSTPASTCFCDSMKTGPSIETGVDLALTELDDDNGHRFLVRVGSPRALAALEGVASWSATERDFAARDALLDDARRQMTRHLDVDGLADGLARNLEHPRWAEVAERCLSCGNCTLVCPTCFCSDVRDTTFSAGRWCVGECGRRASDVDHSYLHGGAVRRRRRSRYRQWMTHKLSSWWDQFDTTGCVGCGRCIAWCPVGIDITEEASAIVRADGASDPRRPAKGVNHENHERARRRASLRSGPAGRAPHLGGGVCHERDV